MAAHSLCHAPDILAACAQEAIPKPEIRAKLGVVPCVAADIVFPLVAHGVVGVHEIAIIPEAVPSVLVYRFLIEVDILVKTFLYFGTVFGRTVGQAPYAECAAVVEIFGSGKHEAGSAHGGSVAGKVFFTAVAFAGVEDEGGGAGDTVGGAHAFLHILVGCDKVVGYIVVVAQIHRL